jgi:cytochrome c-type biogenesis protein CcmE
MYTTPDQEPPVAPRRLLGLKPLHLACIALILLALGYGVTALGASVTPYVSVAEAQASGRSVQVYGFLNDMGGYTDKGEFRFGLKDERGQIMEVVYPKGKPANFEQAIGIVAYGQYDAASQTFQADELLVKCPSKYQEQADKGAVAPH